MVEGEKDGGLKNIKTMKNTLKTLVIAILISVPVFLFAQNPPHPNGGGGPTGGNTPVGGAAPVGGGLVILLGLGFGYGAKKVYRMRR